MRSCLLASILFVLVGCEGDDKCKEPGQILFEYRPPEYTISWTSVPGAVSYTVEYKPSQVPIWDYAVSQTAVSPYVINANPEIAYDFRLITTCPGGTNVTYRKFAYEKIHINSYGFNPSSITVTEGTTVGWLNDDSEVHVIKLNSGLWTSSNIQPGSGMQFSAPGIGTHTYYCANHPSETGSFTFVKDIR